MTFYDKSQHEWGSYKELITEVLVAGLIVGVVYLATGGKGAMLAGLLLGGYIGSKRQKKENARLATLTPQQIDTERRQALTDSARLHKDQMRFIKFIVPVVVVLIIIALLMLK